MAKVTITLQDTEIESGQFKADIVVEHAKTDDGFATAAHVTGVFIHRSIPTKDFSNGLISYGQGNNIALRHTDPATMIITLTDTNLDTGEIESSMVPVEGPVTEGAATAAQLAASFIMAVMPTENFRVGCTMFAESLVEGRGGVVNYPVVPTNEKAA